jgi:GNAT superfamily N-acetyltransferase
MTRLTSNANPARLRRLLTVRGARAADAQECGRICHDAFAAIATRHGFAPDFPSVDVAVGLVSGLIAHPGFYSVVAEHDGRIVGSNFLDERSMIVGVGPITVDPGFQDRQVGRVLMNAVLERSVERRAPGVRLLQVAYHNRSMSLYAKLGFDIREPFAAIQGTPLALEIAGYDVRSATGSDLESCNALCRRVHGHDRAGELLDALVQGTARVVERDDRITGYTTGIAFFAHSVAETNDDLQALIGATEQFAGPGFLVPMRNTELLRWCLAHGLRVFYVMNLMTIGLYQEPRGAFLASSWY